MKNPATFGAFHLATLPISLRHVRDLIDYEGPLLSEFKSEEGETYLYYWCDSSAELNRWLVVRTPPQALFRYLLGLVTLRTVISDCVDKVVYIVDLNSSASTHGAWLLPAQCLPSEYTPGVNSYFQQSGSLEGVFQDVYIDAHDGFEQVTVYPRRYMQAYSVLAMFGARIVSRLLQIDYDFTRGFVYNTFYQTLRDALPLGKEASLAAVGFASPGFLRFKVDAKIAEGVRNAVLLYLQNGGDIEGDSQELKRIAGSGSSDDPSVVDLVISLSSKVGIDGEALMQHVVPPTDAAKVLRSYIRRLGYLAKNEHFETAMLVGLRDHPPE